MVSIGKETLDEEASVGHTVRFDDTLYTDRDRSTTTTDETQTNAPGVIRLEVHRRATMSRRRSGILKRRENTITTADAPTIILSDEGLKAGRVSPFINLPLFLSMTVRSIGIIFGDM